MVEELLMKEKGNEGDPILAREIADNIISRWGQNHKESDTPFLLFLGGLQGSGKTSAITELHKDSDLDFVTIAADEIRWEMFAREVFLTEDTREIWTQTVYLTRNMLLQEALNKGYSIIVDQMVTPERIEVLEEIAQKYPKYASHIKKVILTADPKTLRERVAIRPTSGARQYKGNLGELEASMQKYANMDTTGFDKVIQTDTLPMDVVASEIKDLLS